MKGKTAFVLLAAGVTLCVALIGPPHLGQRYRGRESSEEEAE